ncbi:MFS transporter [Microlunatus panaciterrae]
MAVEMVQRRTVRTLVGSQMLGGIGVASGIAVAAILAEEMLGSAGLAGLASTAQVLGGAILAVPMARLMAGYGRRAGLLAGYLTGAAGAALAVLAGVWSSFPLLLLAAALFGAATASNNQARYAATDLATPQHRGRSLALVVWATTVGAVLGPNLIGVAGDLAGVLGLPRLVGPFLFSLVGFLLAGGLLLLLLRPDPLVLARQVAADAGEDTRSHGSVLRGFRVIVHRPAALLGVIAVAIGHTVMVAVMVMTPLHMHDGGAELQLVGFVISVHILGMYAFSPLTGALVDRVGARPVILAGVLLFGGATFLAGRAAEGWSMGLMLGLFLLGVGWSCTMVAGSTLLSAAVPVSERPGVQGAGDLTMGLAAAVGGALAGLVVGGWGYGWLCVGAAVLAGCLLITTLLLRPDPVRDAERV